MNAGMKVLAGLMCVIMAGCATLFNEKDPAVSFQSNPSEAKIYVNGNYMGETPVALELKTDKSYTIEFRKEGYESKTYFLNNKIGVGWVVLDVLGGFIPIIVDAVTGAWYEFDQENVVVLLE
jgi:hypothetical protein